MLTVLRQRDLSLLWFGGVLSVIGDYFLFVALPFFVFEQTASALATGAIFIAETLPRLLFGSVAGVFVDRWDRKRTMVVSDLSRALILLPLLAAAAGGPLVLWSTWWLSWRRACRCSSRRPRAQPSRTWSPSGI